MRPNIVIILTDQQSAQMMSCAGNPNLRTPAMDRLAAEGTRFERAYCTDPVCVASRFSLMTGRMPSEIALISNGTEQIERVPEEIMANGLGHIARRAGYRALYGGKVHLPKMSAEDVGFEYLCRDERDDLAAFSEELLSEPPAEPFLYVASLINPHDICYVAIQDCPEDPAAQAFIRRGTTECATLNAARERPPGVDDATYYARHCPELPANFSRETDEPSAVTELVARRAFKQKARDTWDANRWRDYRRAYARLTERVDGQIARLLTGLDRNGLAERTVVIFTSDHGDMNGAHHLGQKSTLYEEACRIPLIIREPGSSPAVNATSLVSNGLDLLPTVADYLGVAPPPGLRGRSLRPLVGGETLDAWRRWLPIESTVGRAVVTTTYKLADYDLVDRQRRVYDLTEPVLEVTDRLPDLAGTPFLAQLEKTFTEAFGSAPRNPDEVDAAAGNA